MTGSGRARARVVPTPLPGAEGPGPEGAVWHDVECGSYTEDLALWRELASGRGAALELGCGSGRVTLDLARHGYTVTGLDSDPELIAALRARARAEGLRAQGEIGDARRFDLGRAFRTVLAPMQVVQLLGGAAGRAQLFESARRHLDRGGILALALADPFDDAEPEDFRPPLPDQLEKDGWVYSSTPVAVRRAGPESAAIERVRQAVSPSGELFEHASVLTLDLVGPEPVEHEAAASGFTALGRREVAPTDDYVGSTVVVLEAA